MDCDRFERMLMDVLYDELDELSSAAAKRHSDQCQRCSGLLARFRATRGVGSLPLEAPPDRFEAQVMDAERQARRALPLGARLSRQLIILAGYATRPQLAMAALALLMIGSSLLFLRPNPSPRSMSVQVNDGRVADQPADIVVPIAEAPPLEAIPNEPELAAPEPAPVAKTEERSKPSPPAAGIASATAASDEDELDKARARAEDRAYTAAMAALRASNHLAAQKQFDTIVAAGGRNAPAAELYAALATEQALGCASALPRFDSVSAKNGSNHLGHMATWHSAACRSKLGHTRRADLDFQKLLKVPAYADRAKAALAHVGGEIPDSIAPAASIAASATAGATTTEPSGKSSNGVPTMAPTSTVPNQPPPATAADQ